MKLFPFVLLRTPAHSLNSIDNKDIWSSEIFKEGVYVSSKALFNEFERKGELDPKKSKKVGQSIFKYWTRNCARSTPFGTFAGFLRLDVSDKPTDIVLNDSESHVRHNRLDMDCLFRIIEAILENTAVRMQLRLFPNESIYEAGDQIRYVEYDLKNNLRNYKLSSITANSYVLDILGFCKNGARLQELAVYLAEKEEVDYEDAEAFIVEMWQSQVLVSDLEPPVTGIDPLVFLIDKLSAFEGIEKEMNTLLNIQELLANSRPGVSNYMEIENKIAELCGQPIDSKTNIQTDLSLNALVRNIEKELVDRIVDQCEELFPLSRKFSVTDLDLFKSRFQQKFGNESIPLVLAMDSDLGVGYAHDTEKSADLLGVTEGMNPDDSKSYNGNSGFDFIQQYALKKFTDYLREGKESVELFPAELKALASNVETYKFPNSMYILGNLMTKNGKVDADNFTFNVDLIGGPSAGSLLGRFTYGDEELLEFTRNALLEEEKEHPEAIYAEIVHLPQSRIGNILQRPVLREYEIPYICKSGVVKEKQISVQDLLVCIENNEVVLWSKRLNKRIIPRLTTAHNFVVNSLPLYKFLCDLQVQGKAFRNVWDWGNLSILKHLPRVVYKDLVIRKAEWKVNKVDFPVDHLKDEAMIAEIRRIRSIYKIPSKITFANAGNDLLMDLESLSGIDLFFSFLNKKQDILIKEFLFTEENSVVKDLNHCGYANELVIPVGRKVQPVPDIHRRTIAPSLNVLADQKFLIGSEWLYFKIYASQKQLGELVAGPLYAFLKMELEMGHFEKVFFIRYKDTGTHIRIRMFNSDLSKQPALQQRFMAYFKPLVLNGDIENIMMDTYIRETERYIPELIGAAETLFHNDSLFCMQILNHFAEELGDQLFIVAMHAIESLLDDFDFILADRHQLLSKMQEAFFMEFNGNANMQKDLNRKFRDNKTEINAFIDLEDQRSINYYGFLKERSDKNKSAVEIIKAHIGDHTISGREQLYKLLPSYIHMQVNRMFEKDQRTHELLIYHLMERYYHNKLMALKTKQVDSVL